jgi:FMN phosphatase YigB (HAD superfamily)
MKSYPDTIIFDLDDTLVDTSSVFFRMKEKFIQLMASESHPEQTVREAFNRIDEENLVRFGYISERNLVSLRETYEWLTLTTGRTFSASILQQIADIGKHTLYALPRPMPHMRTLMKWCAARYRLALLTRGSCALQRAKVDALGLHGFFEVVSVVSRKDTEAFQETVASMNREPHQCISIGDSLSFDIAPAIAIGMAAIHVPYIYSAIQWNHDKAFSIDEIDQKYNTVTNLPEVKRCLQEMAALNTPALAR